MGRPVITTDAPGCRETVVDGENGCLVPVKDPEALAEAMLRFCSDKEKVLSMAHKARKFAEEKFDVEIVCNIQTDTIRKAMKK